jgi:hypothetical protein
MKLLPDSLDVDLGFEVAMQSYKRQREALRVRF